MSEQNNRPLVEDGRTVKVGDSWGVRRRKDKPSIYKPLPRDAYGNTVDDYAEKILKKREELELLRERYMDLKGLKKSGR